MMTKRGVLELLQMADGNEPKSFNDFTKISVKGRRLSSATVSKRLDELISTAVIKEVITRSKSGRRVIAYKTTEKGKRVIELAAELEKMLANAKSR